MFFSAVNPGLQIIRRFATYIGSARISIQNFLPYVFAFIGALALIYVSFLVYRKFRDSISRVK